MKIVLNFFYFLFFFSLSFYSYFTFSVNRDPNKISDLIGEKSRSFSKKKIFFLWDSKKISDELLRVGGLNQELYYYFAGMAVEKQNTIPNSIWFRAGPGAYVVDYVVRTPYNHGDHLIQLEVDPNNRYIDLSDKNVVHNLKSKGITKKDVYKLAHVNAIKLNSHMWVLKIWKGVRVKPFSLKEYLSPEYFTQVYQGVDLLSLQGELDLSPQQKRAIVKKTLPLVRTVEDARVILSSSLFSKYLYPAERESLFRKAIALTETIKDAKLLSSISEGISSELKKIMTKKIVSLIKTIEDGINLFVHKKSQHVSGLNSMSEEGKAVLKEINYIVDENFENRSRLLFSLSSYIDIKDRLQLLKKTIPHIKNGEQAIKILPYVVSDVMKYFFSKYRYLYYNSQHAEPQDEPDLQYKKEIWSLLEKTVSRIENKEQAKKVVELLSATSYIKNVYGSSDVHDFLFDSALVATEYKLKLMETLIPHLNVTEVLNLFERIFYLDDTSDHNRRYHPLAMWVDRESWGRSGRIFSRIMEKLTSIIENDRQATDVSSVVHRVRINRKAMFNIPVHLLKGINSFYAKVDTQREIELVEEVKGGGLCDSSFTN